MVSGGRRGRNLINVIIIFQSLDLLKGENYENKWLGYDLQPHRIEKRSLSIDPEDFSNEQSFEPIPKVSGLLKRTKRFGCWHSCIGPPQPYVKQETCHDGSACSCLVDLLGNIHGIACMTGGRNPMGSDNPDLKPVQNGPVTEKKLQCNYKTCWTVEDMSGRKRRMNIMDNSTTYKLASVIQGIYYQGKCNCGQEGSITPEQVRPAALNHVHQREDYKFALSFKTFPDPESGKCVCRFGKTLNDPSPGGDRSLSNSEESASYSEETHGVRTLTEKETMKNDDSRDIIQCGLTGCRHVIIKISNSRSQDGGGGEDEGKSDKSGKSKSKPWYLLEIEKTTRLRKAHTHSTATSVQCNLKTCWRVEDGTTKLQGDVKTQQNDDPLRESFQLTLQQRRKLLNQRGKIKLKKKSGVNVNCAKGVCTLSRDTTNVNTDGTKNQENRHGHHSNSNDDEEIVPGIDGLCPCHKAYMTYYNWKH